MGLSRLRLSGLGISGLRLAILGLAGLIQGEVLSGLLAAEGEVGG